MRPRRAAPATGTSRDQVQDRERQGRHQLARRQEREEQHRREEPDHQLRSSPRATSSAEEAERVP